MKQVAAHGRVPGARAIWISGMAWPKEMVGRLYDAPRILTADRQLALVKEGPCGSGRARGDGPAIEANSRRWALP